MITNVQTTVTQIKWSKDMHTKRSRCSQMRALSLSLSLSLIVKGQFHILNYKENSETWIQGNDIRYFGFEFYSNQTITHCLQTPSVDIVGLKIYSAISK